MLIDAVVLAGGRSSRLGSVAKALLVVEGQSLLERTVSAAMTVSRECIVVGPVEPQVFTMAVLTTREDPPFSGPAAALAAGVRAIAATRTSASDAILVLACDMPWIARQVPVLTAALASAPAEADGVISVDDHGRNQPLACLYRSNALAGAIARFAPAALTGLSMRELIEPLNLVPVAASAGTTDDVDTWEDAARLGATRPDTAQPETTASTSNTKEGTR